MSDRELLLKAAKAAGYVVVGYVDDMIAQPGHRAGGLVLRNDRGGDSAWHPLTDDGDALRLAVKRGFQLDIETPCGCVSVGLIREFFQHDDDEAARAATRRCIVRAAAAIGESKP